MKTVFCAFVLNLFLLLHASGKELVFTAILGEDSSEIHKRFGLMIEYLSKALCTEFRCVLLQSELFEVIK